MTVSKQNVESQLNEIDFLRSLYDCVKVSPHNVIDEFQAFLDGKLDDVYNQITCTITLNDVKPPAEVEVSIPHSYPTEGLRFLVAVHNYSGLNQRVEEFVSTFQDEHEPGTFCISFVVDFVREVCRSRLDASVAEIAPNVASDRCLCRIWLLSHHIYDKVKRKKLLELSAEKSVGGFTLPGKPGVICLEGNAQSCLEAVTVIKSWNWQRIRVKLEEKTVDRRRFNGYVELSCYKTTQTACERPHMDLGAFSRYLEEHDLKFAFKELFDIDSNFSTVKMRLFLVAVGKAVGAASQKLFGKHLLLTNSIISTGMGLAGDGVQQYYELSRGYQEHFQKERSSHMAAAGFTTGVVTHYWYALLDRWWQGRCLRVITKKVLFDQILFSPVCLTVYFGTVAVLENSTMEQFREELTDKGGTVYVAEWLVWPLAQAYNFYYLPLKYRLAFDTVISFGFDVFTPYVKYRNQRILEDQQQTKLHDS